MAETERVVLNIPVDTLAWLRTKLHPGETIEQGIARVVMTAVAYGRGDMDEKLY
jgi:hypothetical protein